MSFNRLVWEDRRVEFPNRFKLINNPGGTVDLEERPGIVENEGTPISAGHMNRMEQGIFDAQWQGDAPIAGAVTSLHNGEGGNLERVDEHIGGVLRRRTSLGYANGSLNTVNVKVYASDGATVEREWTDTLTYSNGELVDVTREVIS